MNISIKNLSGFLFPPAGGLKSERERQQRRQDMQGQVEALKAGQAALKNRECDTLESIAEKLELYHSYESEIAEVKRAYNIQEMSHVMDEAEERGEKIADAAKKRAPKTEEERRKEALAEATGTEPGMLAKLLEENPLNEKLLEEDPFAAPKEELPDEPIVPEEPIESEKLPDEPIESEELPENRKEG